MEKKFKLLLIFSIFWSALTVYFVKFEDLRTIFTNLYVEYEAVLDLDETLYLNEKYIYHINEDNKFRMLYRNWKVPLFYKKDVNYPYIKLIDIDNLYNFEWYVKDYKGNIYGELSEISKQLVYKLAYDNETGIINPDYFNAGSYEISMNYEVYPPIEKDENNFHINIKLADEHVFYKNVKIQIIDTNNVIEKIYPHLSDFSIKNIDNSYIITGISPQNGIVGVELLTKHFNLDGFFRETTSVKEKTENANKHLYWINNMVKLFKNFLFISVLAFPVILYIIYIKFGKEKDFLVPEFISFVPNRERKPYVVNLIFSGDATSANENAFYSTILDLAERGYLNINTTPELEIEILNKIPEDKYEKKVISFLKRHSEKDISGKYIFNPDEFSRKIKRWAKEEEKNLLSHIKKELNLVFNYKDNNLSSKFLDIKGRKVILVLLFIIFVIFFIVMFSFLFFRNTPLMMFIDYYPIILLTLSLFINGLVALLTPSQIFGRWKEYLYKEKLEWDSFRKFLSNLAMIKKYKPEDLVIWKEWLIYGTSLGVADNVEKALEELNIKIPEVQKYKYTRRRLYNTYHSSISSINSALSSSKSSGSSFGGSGGFGGGGTGGR